MVDQWRQRAACRDYDPELWFALHGTVQEAHAIRTCRGCPVRRQCGDHALSTGERWGIWGGQRLDPPPRGHQPGYRICQHCRRSWWTSNPTAIYCRPRCQQEAQNARRRRERLAAKLARTRGTFDDHAADAVRLTMQEVR